MPLKMIKYDIPKFCGAVYLSIKEKGDYFDLENLRLRFMYK